MRARGIVLLWLACTLLLRTPAGAQAVVADPDLYNAALALDLPEQAALYLEDLRLQGQGTNAWQLIIGSHLERANLPEKAVQAYEGLRGGNQVHLALFRLVILYADHLREMERAERFYARLWKSSPDSPQTFLARATLLRAKGEVAQSTQCLDSAIQRFRGNTEVQIARFRSSVMDGDTAGYREFLPSPQLLATASTGALLEIARLFHSRWSAQAAREFLEAAESHVAEPYALWRRLAPLYRELGFDDEELRVQLLVCAADSVTFDALHRRTVPKPQRQVQLSIKAALESRWQQDGAALLEIAQRLDGRKKYAAASMALERYVGLPFADSAQIVPSLETIMTLYHLRGRPERSSVLADELIERCNRLSVGDPFAFPLMVVRAKCHYVKDDFLAAEVELRQHVRRANDVERRSAVTSLLAFAERGINKQDVLSAIAKFYGDIVIPPKVSPDTASVPPSVSRMALESFTESGKVNPEADKAYVLVRSLVPMLRFDSNRTIHKVEQISSGDWELWLPAGTHILKIDAAGYQRLELPPINFARRRSYEISIRKSLDD